MRVLIIGNAVYVHIRRWCEGLASHPIDLTLLSKTEYCNSRVNWIADHVPAVSFQRPWRYVRRRRIMLQRILEEVRPDIVHVHFPGPFTVFPDDIFCPLIVSVWGSDIIPVSPESPAERVRKQQILLRATRVVALSRMLCAATYGYAGTEKVKLETSHWGVALDVFQRQSAPCSAPVIGFAKHFEQKYGPQYLLEAASLLKKQMPDLQLIMAGKGSMDHELKKLAIDLGLDNMIEWVGALDYSAMPRFYERLAVSVMPSVYHSETLGVAALESQAMKVPVVATCVGGIPESVRDGQTGLLVPPRDSKALAQAIGELLQDGELRTRMGKAGRALIETEFDWHATIARMIGLYDEVSQADRPRP